MEKEKVSKSRKKKEDFYTFSSSNRLEAGYGG